VVIIVLSLLAHCRMGGYNVSWDYQMSLFDTTINVKILKK